MEHPLRHRRALTTLVLGCVAFSVAGCSSPEVSPLSLPATTETPPREIVLVPRTPYLATYPCAGRCHGPDADAELPPRFHSSTELVHGPVLQECAMCHEEGQMDELRLIDGSHVPFDSSQRVCAQCHAARYEGWVQGIHGLVTRAPDGRSQRRVCTACHDPHAPSDIHLQALPPPPRPGHD